MGKFRNKHGQSLLGRIWRTLANIASNYVGVSELIHFNTSDIAPQEMNVQMM